jgi:hypothetical protein
MKMAVPNCGSGIHAAGPDNAGMMHHPRKTKLRDVSENLEKEGSYPYRATATTAAKSSDLPSTTT